MATVTLLLLFLLNCKSSLESGFLLIADSSPGGLYKLELSNMNFTQIPISEDLHTPTAITYDPATERVIWADVGTNKISSTFINGSGNIVILDDSSSHIDGMEIDVENRFLFYSDTGNDIVARISLDTSVSENIITTNLSEPRAIVLDPANEYIYWTDWGTTPKIERSNYDGSNRRTVTEVNLTWPNGLAIDTDDDALYLCDAGTDLIEKMKTDGDQREVVANISGSHCFDLYKIETEIYFSDWSKSFLRKTNLDGTLSDLTTVGVTRGMGLHFVADIDECLSQPCQNNGTCLDRVNHYVCDCAPGYNDTNCENDIDECANDPCQNNGSCTDLVNAYECSCAPGFNGTNCETDIDECLSQPCQNNGTCLDRVNHYVCGCAPGYNDTNCENDIDECANDPCQNNGSCTDLVNAYECSCITGYNGTVCEIVVIDIPIGIQTVSVQFTLLADFNQVINGNEDEFKNIIAEKNSTLLGISRNRISEIIIRSGSIIVEVVLLTNTGTSSAEPELGTAVSTLQTAVQTGNLTIIDTSGNPLPVDPNSFDISYNIDPLPIGSESSNGRT